MMIQSILKEIALLQVFLRILYALQNMLEFHSLKEHYAEHSVPKAPIEPL